MKRRFAYFLIVFSILSFSFIETELKKLIPGKGIADEIIVGETTREDIQKKFGTDFKEFRYYTKKDGDSTLYSTALYYEKQGLKFYFKPGEKGTFSANFFSAYPAITDKGIRAGVSTMQDVIDAYGKSEWYTSGSHMFLEYNGISFNIPYDGKSPIKKSVYKKAKKTKVSFITIRAMEQ